MRPCRGAKSPFHGHTAHISVGISQENRFLARAGFSLANSTQKSCYESAASPITRRRPGGIFWNIQIFSAPSFPPPKNNHHQADCFLQTTPGTSGLRHWGGLGLPPQLRVPRPRSLQPAPSSGRQARLGTDRSFSRLEDWQCCSRHKGAVL